MSNARGSITLSAALLCAFWELCIPSAWAAEKDLKFEAKLVWGTDDIQSKGKEQKDLKVLDPKILEKLRSVFKWKHYYEIETKNDIIVAKGARAKVKMSAKCELEISNLGENRVEVTLVGEGKRVVNDKQTVTPGQLMVLGGDGHQATAWFVVLIPSKPRE